MEGKWGRGGGGGGGGRSKKRLGRDECGEGVGIPFTDEVRKMKSRMVTARARWLLS